jgi:hypothetical protein
MLLPYHYDQSERNDKHKKPQNGNCHLTHAILNLGPVIIAPKMEKHPPKGIADTTK